MSLEVIETGEVVEPLSRVEAERLTARIADKLDSIADNLEQVLPLIGEALTRDAWNTLGYSSPTAYVSDRFAKSFERLPIEVRRPVVAELSAAGMSTRQIAPVMGFKSAQTVRADLSNHQVGDRHPPEKTPEPPREFTDHGLPKSEKIIGKDGKQYARPEPSGPHAPRAESVTNQFSGAVVDLTRAMDKLHRISENHNFPRNKEQIATLHGSDLSRAISELQTIADALN